MSNNIKNYLQDFSLNELVYSIIFDNPLPFFILSFDEPIPLDLTENKILDQIYNNAKIIEFNNPFKDLFSTENNKIRGRTFFNLVETDNHQSVEFLSDFILSGYKTDRFILDMYINKNIVWFSINAAGFIKDNKLLYIWGTLLDISKFKKNQELVFQAFNNINLGLAIIQNDKIVFYNESFLKLLNLSKKEIKTTDIDNFKKILHPDDRSIVVKNISDKISGKPVDQVQEFRLITSDNEIKWVSSSSVIFNYKNKKAVLVCYRDITEHINAIENLKDTKNIFKTFFDNSSLGLAILDVNKPIKFIEVNNKLASITGISCEDHIGKTVYDTYSDKKIAYDHRDLLADLIINKKLCTIESFAKNENGEIVYYISTLFPIINHENVMKYLGVIVIDITKIKEAEKIYIENEEKYKILLNNANDMIFVNPIFEDTFGNFVEVNDTVCDFLELTKEELYEMSPFYLYPELENDAIRIIKELLNNGYALFEKEFITKTGKIYFFEINSHVFEYNKQKMVMSIGRDITDRKNAEEKLLRYKEDLEIKVKKRTDELVKLNENLKDKIEELKKTQIKLVQSEKMASIGRLTAGIAHEINNPINFILASAKALKRNMDNLNILYSEYEILFEELNDSQKVNINKIKKDINYQEIIEEMPSIMKYLLVGSERTTDIVKSLRVFTRHRENVKDKYDLQECIDSALIILKDRHKYNIEIFKNYNNIPGILCYSGKINQVVLNIINNAIDVLENEDNLEKREIRIETNVEKKDKIEYAIIKIKNTGPAIPHNIKDKIFEPFFTTKKLGQGTGLGLAICFNIIEEHNGFITVNSEEGVGTTFSIYIPYT